MVRVVLLASLKELLGKSEIEVKVHGRMYLKDFVKTLVDLDERFSLVLDGKEGRPKPGVLLLINGRDHRVYGEQALVDEGDEVLLLPVNHGG